MKSHFRLGPEKWPLDQAYKGRFFVPDLSPQQRAALASNLKPRLVFVAESPHEAETRPEALDERRPLCGKAGRDWWKMVSQLVDGTANDAVDLERLLLLCRQAGIAVMNAVQFPLDPKITAYYGPQSDPVVHLGFSKVPPASFKKLRAGPEVVQAVAWLRERLLHPSLAQLPVVSLGNDAQWFVAQAIGVGGRNLMTVPHPSAWWRQGGKLREKARSQLTSLLGADQRGFGHERAQQR